MSEWTELDFEARRAAHRRGHSKPLRNRAAIDRSYDAVASSVVSISATQFVPDGILTDDNIDGAIDAAIAKAIELTEPGLDAPGYVVTVPAGVWRLTSPHHFPAFENYRPAVGFRGAGMYETVFLVETDADASAVFTFGTESFDDPTALGMTLGLHVSDFSVVAAQEGSCIRTGVRIYGAVNPWIRNVRVRGLVDALATPEQCRGIEILPGTVDGTELNGQFVDIRDCDVYGCLIGVFIRTAYPVTLDNVHSRGCIFNGVLQNTTVVWSNSDIQGGGPLDAAHSAWYGNRNMPSVMSGWDATDGLQNGAGATCAAQADMLCLVTLPGATLNARDDKARWLRLEPTGASDANKLKVRGVYKIERVVSATTALIRKGSNHTSQDGLDWQICEAAGAVMITARNCYNEGPAQLIATFGAWRDTTRGSSWCIERSEIQGGQFAIEADDIRDVVLRGLREQNASDRAARLSYVDFSSVDQDVSRVEFDDYSYFGLTCYDNVAFPNGPNRGTYRTANGGAQVRLRACLQELGAVEIWDARVTDSLSLTGSDVNSITGLLNSTLLVPHAGGVKPTYNVLDAVLLAPSIVGATGVAAARCFVHGTIPSAILPDFGYTTTLVLVGRVPDTNIVTTRRIQALTTLVGGEYVQHIIGLNDSVYMPTGPYQFYASYNNYPTQQGQVSFSLTADTDPHVFVSGAVRAIGSGSQVHSWDEGIYVGGGAVSAQPSHCLGSDMVVSLGGHLGATESGSLVWTLFAVIPHALSHAEHQKIVDLARNEFPLTES